MTLPVLSCSFFRTTPSFLLVIILGLVTCCNAFLILDSESHRTDHCASRRAVMMQE